MYSSDWIELMHFSQKKKKHKNDMVSFAVHHIKGYMMYTDIIDDVYN